jgi:2-methoxy-6-polyprenyl-1,4-benzoquinol methylase
MAGERRGLCTCCCGCAHTLRLYRQYSFQVIPVLGQVIAGDHASYKYLVESIERFPSQPDFSQL